MATLKDIAALFGFPVDKENDFDIDKFRQHVDGNYIAREEAIKDPKITGAIVGSRMGSITTKLASAFSLDAGTIKDKKVEDIIEMVAGQTNNTVESLKKKLSEGNDKKLNDLMQQLAEKEKSVNDYKKLADKTADEFENYKKESQNLFKAYKVSNELKSIKSQIPFIDDFSSNALLQAGFESVIGNKYQFDLDEQDNLEVKTKTGEYIKSKKNAGKMATAEEVLMAEAEEAKLIKKNKGPQQPVIPSIQQPKRDEQPKRRLNLNALNRYD
ncbi:MAG TPA: hypothetical protein VG603_02365 [Chitinophagales bacterium]|nr:hypothetical protein [Chitinophagales bacterium]